MAQRRRECCGAPFADDPAVSRWGAGHACLPFCRALPDATRPKKRGPDQCAPVMCFGDPSSGSHRRHPHGRSRLGDRDHMGPAMPLPHQPAAGLVPRRGHDGRLTIVRCLQRHQSPLRRPTQPPAWRSCRRYATPRMRRSRLRSGGDARNNRRHSARKAVRLSSWRSGRGQQPCPCHVPSAHPLLDHQPPELPNSMPAF